MKEIKLPAYNFGMFVGYAEMIPVCKTFKDGTKCAEISLLIPGEKGSYKVFVTGDLAEEVARGVKPEDLIIAYGRMMITKNDLRPCVHSVNVVNYGKDVDAQHMEALEVIKPYTIFVPAAGYHDNKGK